MSTVISGCSVFMAAKQPEKKNIELLRIGTRRALLVSEFGLPISSSSLNGEKVEIFKFIDGYSAGAKAGRAVFRGAADIFTFGLWEIIGTPREGVFNGDEIVYQVKYDQNDFVKEVALLKK